ncbi:MAG: ABC transporter substrate-binding protein [Candidatus Binatia bacterium]
MHKKIRIQFGLSYSGNPKSKIANPKWVGIITYVISFAFCGVVGAQPARIPLIGNLQGAPLAAVSALTGAFRQGLRELEYVEGKNIVIEWRSAEGKLDRFPALVAELVRLKVDIIVTAGPIPTRAAKEATSTIPIIMAQDPDPVGSGFVASLARPGGNITGLSTLAPELSGKRLELLKETVPKVSRVAVLGTSTYPGNAQSLKEVELAAAAFKVQLQYLNVLDLKDIETAFRAASKGRADAVLVMVAGGIASGHRTEIAELAVKNRLPVMYDRQEYVEAGGLIAYSVNYNDLARRAATYVDKILKGAKPADLPVEQPKKFDFIVNLKAAKQIGLTIPPNLLVRADKVIR